MKKTIKWLLVGFILMFYTNISVRAVSLSEYEVNIDTVEDKKIEVLYSEGEVTFESLDESIFTVTEEGVITPIKDGIALLKVTEEGSEDIKILVFVSAFGTIDERMEEIYNEIPSTIDVNFAEEVAKNSDKSYYWNDYLLGESWNLVNNIDDNYMVSDLKIENGKITFDIASNFSIEEDGRYYYADSIKYPKQKEIIVNYKKGNQKDLEVVTKASKNVKKKYKSYINSIFGDLFNNDIDSIEKMMIENSDLEKDLKNKDITYYMDSRRGILLSEYNMFAGYLQLGINGIMYDFTEVEFESVLRMPKIKDKKNALEEIKKYFIENLISDNEDVEIEDCGNGIYKAIITDKKESNVFMGKIMNILLPSVNADSEKSVKFSVEEVLEEETPIINKPIDNPNTSDNILIYFYLVIISLFSLNILRKIYNK